MDLLALRESLGAAGLAPDELTAVAQEQKQRGTVFGVGPGEHGLAGEDLESRGTGGQQPAELKVQHANTNLFTLEKTAS